MPEFPYFPLYPKDLLADHKVMLMTTEEFGAYVRLLCIAWHESPPASLPHDDPILARYAGVDSSRWAAMKPVVLAPFGVEGRRYVQKRLRREFERLAQRSAKAVQSASARWSKSDANAMPTHSEGNTHAFGSGSGSSGSTGGGVGEVKSPPLPRPERGTKVPAADLCALALAAHAAFGKPPAYPSQIVLGNVGELLRMGRADAEIIALCRWAKTTDCKHKPKSANALTDPEKFEQWQTMLKEDGHDDHGQNREF